MLLTREQAKKWRGGRETHRNVERNFTSQNERYIPRSSFRSCSSATGLMHSFPNENEDLLQVLARINRIFRDRLPNRTMMWISGDTLGQHVLLVLLQNVTKWSVPYSVEPQVQPNSPPFRGFPRTDTTIPKHPQNRDQPASRDRTNLSLSRSFFHSKIVERR